MVANGLEGVPWMVGGGQAKHSADLGRVLAYAATGGGAGVISPGDLLVSPSSTADKYVHMGVGAVVVRNLQSNARSQSYVSQATQVSDLAIAATGSSARSDLVVVRIKDPQYGWSAPADPVNGPYAVPEIIPGVPANTTRAEQLNLSQALYAVARIDVPANTTGPAITQGMIKDLRELVQARFWPDTEVQSGVGTAQGGATHLNTTDTAWTNWPLNTKTVAVPAWATKAVVTITLNNLPVDGACDFNSRINLGGLTGSKESMFDYNGNAGTTAGYIEHLTHSTVDTIDVRSIAGQTVTCRLQSRRTYPQNAGNIGFGSWEQIVFDIKFYEQVA